MHSIRIRNAGIGAAMAVPMIALLLAAAPAESRDRGFNQPGRVGNTTPRDPGVNQPGAAGNVKRDPGVNQPGAAGNAMGDAGVNQPGAAGNRHRR